MIHERSLLEWIDPTLMAELKQVVYTYLQATAEREKEEHNRGSVDGEVPHTHGATTLPAPPAMGDGTIVEEMESQSQGSAARHMAHLSSIAQRVGGMGEADAAAEVDADTFMHEEDAGYGGMPSNFVEELDD